MPVLRSKIDSVVAKRAELKVLNKAIAKRKKYYREQEKLIIDLVETGNTQLMGLNHDIMFAKKELRDIKTDIRTFAHDKVLLVEDIRVLQVEMNVLAPTGPLVLPAFG